jgi:hypothetical protein
MIIAALSLVVACAELGGETRERPGWSTTAMVSLSVLPLALGAMEVGAVWACLLGGSSAGDGGQDAPVDRPSMCRNAVVPEQPGQAHTVSNGPSPPVVGHSCARCDSAVPSLSGAAPNPLNDGISDSGMAPSVSTRRRGNRDQGSTHLIVKETVCPISRPRYGECLCHGSVRLLCAIPWLTGAAVSCPAVRRQRSCHRTQCHSPARDLPPLGRRPHEGRRRR